MAKHSSPDIAKASNGLLPRRLLTFFHAISRARQTDTCVRYITYAAKIIGNDCPNDIAEEQVHHLWFHKREANLDQYGIPGNLCMFHLNHGLYIFHPIVFLGPIAQ
jgi:hypothetical protein